ncbi:glutamine synthetase, catalytic domain-containing protein [Hirsutella rhossiliensis]|uniref:Glutamine synthetase, catalytic domain-containing protein n=1 Tax=Hirsutella rhossiliensis TaxID=111463 RepID=A0A9P8SCY4_9HYPO|nr:glutamine synthetase, catalytic domain-containing protein [Hirsutella rhossiliensis]KAH0958143.1 glutamine synthetase, catalytic domain-containing protein [Hirsutella rhossiliensis]
MDGPGDWRAIWARHSPEFVWVCHMPYNGACWTRMFPADELAAMSERGERASIPSAAIFATRQFRLASGGSPSGALYLQPDWSSAYAHPSGGARRVEVMASWVDEQGEAAAECARSTLGRLARSVGLEHGLALLLGFEVELVFRPCAGHVASDEQTLCMVEAAVRALREAGVPVRQFHAEAAPRQWEFVLGAVPPLEAVDGLVRARRVLAFIARAHGAQATLHPRPVATEFGTGAHVHISATPLSPTATSPDSFFAGILHHLRAVAAFTLPLDVSYHRVRPGIWSGGEYVCWGWQNREAPLRRISATRFEVRTLCGTANPYLALAALLAAGLDGLRGRMAFTTADCQQDPAKLSDAQRQALGIRHRLPTSVDESLEALEQDAPLREIMGTRLAAGYSAVTREWNDDLRAMDEHDRHEFLLANY